MIEKIVVVKIQFTIYKKEKQTNNKKIMKKKKKTSLC